MKNTKYAYLTIITVLFLLLSTSCKKDDVNATNQTNGKTSAVFNPNLTYGTMTDQDGNVYKTIHINAQTWMAENLRTTKYRNGDPIPKIVDSTAWSSLNTGAYCNYENTENIDTIATYGRLYNWYAISDSRNIAPKGWHVATNSEWKRLILLLSREGLAGTKLKEAGNFHWYGNEKATNESGLTILPSGIRSPSSGEFCCMGVRSILWSGTQSDDSYAWVLSLNSYSDSCKRISLHVNYGFAIRCVKD